MSLIRRPARLVFVDTSAYFAAANPRDEDHAGVSELLRQLVADEQRFVTTNLVLAELHALLVNRVNRFLALQVLEQIEASRETTIEPVITQDEQRARAILRQYDDKDFSLTDAISFAVMERLGIRRVFTLDSHFGQYGWELIRPT